MKLTISEIAKLKLNPGVKDKIWFDDAVPGFGYRMRESGKRTFVFQYQIGRKKRRLVIGSAAALKPDKAREIAADHHADVRQGIDPLAEKAIRQAEAALSFEAVAERYLARQQERLRPRSYTEAERHIQKYSAPLNRLPISSIDQGMIASRIGAIADVAGNVTANRVRASLSALFSWAMKEGLAKNNPVANTNKHAEQSRDRVLTDAELAIIWNACRDDQYGSIVKLLMLTGQRLTEISDLRWSEVNDQKRLIDLPGARCKNGRPHQVPLSTTAAGIIASQPKIEGRDLMFGYGDRPFAGWTHAKAKLDERIAELNGKPLPHWTPHDLRRTCATRMGDLGIAPHVIEAVLNHVSGHRSGIAGIYNKSLYTAEKAQALTLWADHVAAVIDGRASNVTLFKQAVA
jgi:integrase